MPTKDPRMKMEACLGLPHLKTKKGEIKKFCNFSSKVLPKGVGRPKEMDNAQVPQCTKYGNPFCSAFSSLVCLRYPPSGY